MQKIQGMLQQASSFCVNKQSHGLGDEFHTCMKIHLQDYGEQRDRAKGVREVLLIHDSEMEKRRATRPSERSSRGAAYSRLR